MRLRLLQQRIGGQTHLALWAEFARLDPARPNDRRGHRTGQLIFRTHIAQRTVQRAIQEIVDHAPVTETHFVFGRVDVDVYRCGIDLEKQREGRVPAIEQHVAISLTNRMGYQFVAHCSAVYEEILQVRLTAVEGRQTDPAPQVQAVAFDLDRQRLLKET